MQRFAASLLVIWRILWHCSCLVALALIRLALASLFLGAFPAINPPCFPLSIAYCLVFLVLHILHFQLLATIFKLFLICLLPYFACSYIMFISRTKGANSGPARTPSNKLWSRGLVPSFDGKTWRLHSGPQAKIVWQGTVEELKRQIKGK